MAKPFRLETKELAEKLYVELLGRSVTIADGVVKTNVNAQNLAKFSFMLAGAFLGVQDELNAENLPKDPTFKLGASDIAEWLK